MTKKKTYAALLGALAVAAAAVPARAQLPAITPFSFEVRGGLALPTGDLKDDGQASTGFTVGGTVTYHAIPMIGIYAGYTHSRFGVDDDVSELLGDGEYTDSGFDVGLRVAIPTPLIPIDPWIKGGLVFHSFEASGFDEPDLNEDVDTEMGFEVGAGLGFGFGPLSITPGVGYVTYGLDDEDVSISYFKAELGVRIRL